MNSIDRKKVTVITSYAIDSFSERDWLTLGQLTGKLDIITNHPRLFRSMSFGDDDYDICAAEIINSVLGADSETIEEIIQHYDIDLWYQQKEPIRYQRIFGSTSLAVADFWKQGGFRVFVSHLSANKVKMSLLKTRLSSWGITAFIAHEDIEPSREWVKEIEAALRSMEVLLAVVEPGFKESNWCAQEVGYALGRNVDVIPLLVGLNPFGFFGNIQGIHIRGKVPSSVAQQIVELLLKKPTHRSRLLACMGPALSTQPTDQKIEQIKLLSSWSLITDDQLRTLLEASSLSNVEKAALREVIDSVGAFKPIQAMEEYDDNDVPF